VERVTFRERGRTAKREKREMEKKKKKEAFAPTLVPPHLLLAVRTRARIRSIQMAKQPPHEKGLPRVAVNRHKFLKKRRVFAAYIRNEGDESH
jgi:hypothetical protein